MARKSTSRSSKRQQALPITHARAAGIDVGSRSHVVAISPTLCSQAVRTYQSFTGDLHRLADWLTEFGI